MLTQSADTIGGALAQAARDFESAAAYIDHGRVVSFAEMDQTCDRIACGLLDLGLKRGDRIAVLALNQIEWLQIFFAATRIGLGVIAMSARYREREFEVMLGDGQACALATLGTVDGFDFLALVHSLRERLPGLAHVITFDGPHAGQIDFAAILATPLDSRRLAAAQASVLADDLAMVIYTSGTTGQPKGAALTHRSMLYSARAQAEHIRASPRDLVQLAMPLNHVGGITCGILTHLLGGGCCELVPVFRAETVLAMMAKHPPTIVVGVPTMLTLLLMNLESDPQAASLESVRLIITGGSNVDATLMGRLMARLPGAAVMNLYGLSESSGALVMTPWNCAREDLLESIGKPFAGARMRVIGTDGEDVVPGEVGELLFTGVGVVAGYIGHAKQSDSFDDEGWLHTGDLARVDERGYVYLKGRKKDMYIQGGFNVYPAEVEGLIAQHPKVLMVAGIGVADPVLGEVGRYYVVARPVSGLSEDEVRQFCVARLADYKVPRQIVLRSELPLTPAGKIHKARLRQES